MTDDSDIKEIQEYLDLLLVQANGRQKEITLIKVPPGFEKHPPVGKYGYGLYFKGDLMPTWENTSCDTCGKDSEPTSCHYIWDAKRKKWRFTCITHFDQFI